MDERLLKVAEVAERFNVPRSWVYAKAEAGTLPSIRIGKYVRFRLSEVERWLEAQRAQ